MSLPQVYTKGTKVWIPDSKLVWESAELLDDYDSQLTNIRLKTESNEIKTIIINEEKDLPFLQNPSILIGINNLIQLSYLHEPGILFNLKIRFCQQKAIYTYCGIVLVAINPYNELPIYSSETINTYRGQNIGDLDPHIFAVCEDAFMELEREQRNQSIIVSGESGAGKTVSAKYAMRYFAIVGGGLTETQIEKKVLASNPIMESIGNAKTIRNDNSSRFGKFIQLEFNNNLHMIGAKMRTYLLEKSRVIYQAENECNYHIFYQLCSAQHLLPELKLQEANHFQYLNPIISNNENDIINDFTETKKALNLLKFDTNEQNNIFKILASILHLGNIKFNEDNSLHVNILQNSYEYFNNFCSLLNISTKNMQKWLCYRQITSVNESCLIPMDLEKALTSRNALAKFIYEKLFKWIVFKINSTLETEAETNHFIGILDIYGFETFENNSFEQFCINYANEKLQNQFNAHVFQLEQEEYLREKIEWKMIEFYDNQSCIDLIEAKLGVFDLLDEECKLPKGSDDSWNEKLITKYMNSKNFSKPKFGNSSFIIHHFADNVEYMSNGFLDKNNDNLMNEQLQVLQKSDNNFLKLLFSDCEFQKKINTEIRVTISAAKMNNGAQKSHKKSVGSQFRDSLNYLMEILNKTTPHYVRCIKPNDNKTNFDFNPTRVVQQLRACGVLETVRLSATGYPGRCSYRNFFQRYRLLLSKSETNFTNKKISCQKILQKLIQDSNNYKFGETKIFFRSGQIAFFEKYRTEKLRTSCIRIQSIIRSFLCRNRFLKIKKSTCLIQIYGRGLLGRRKAYSLRQLKASIIIQKYIRRMLCYNRYQRIKQCILTIQTNSRGMLARRKFQLMKENRMAIIIQKHIRGWLIRRKYQKTYRLIIICQKIIRAFLAKRLFKRLKIEAKSVEHFRNLNKGLENKIISLQQKIDDLNRENKQLNFVSGEISELKNKVKSMKNLENTVNNLNNQVNDQSKQISELMNNLSREKEEKMDLIQENEQLKEQILKSDDDKLNLNKQNIINEKNFLMNNEIYEKITPKNLLEVDDNITCNLNLIIKLQRNLQNVQNENVILQNELNKKTNVSTVLFESIRLVELENENQQLKLSFSTLRKELSTDEKLKKLSEHSDYLEKELKSKRNECEKLRSLLTNQLNISMNITNEDGELTLAYETQKKINKQLELELQKEQEQFEIKENLFKKEIRNVRKEIEKQYDLLVDTKKFNENFEKNEIIRLITLNLQLQDENNILRNNCTHFKNQLFVFAQKLHDLNLLNNEDIHLITKDNYINNESKIIQKSERLSLGMCEFNEGDEKIISKTLIKNLLPRMTISFSSYLPASIIFMCVRFTDYVDNERRFLAFITSIISTLKKTISKRKKDFETQVLWLMNIMCLNNYLKQYSGDKNFQMEYKSKQNEWCLRNFDLFEYQEVFSKIAQEIYDNVIEIIQERIKKLIIPAILEFDIIFSKNTSSRTKHELLNDSQNKTINNDSVSVDIAPKLLFNELDSFLNIFKLYKLYDETLVQIYKQIFHHISAFSLNNLLLRKDLCHWSKGSCIRYNVSLIETWVRDNNFQNGDHLIESLIHITQAAYLLQARKTESDIESICEMCNKLSANQICKILQLYTPKDEFEERIPIRFIEQIHQKLMTNSETDNKHDLLMNTNEKFIFEIPFKYSNTNFEEIIIPEILQLETLKKI